MKQVSRFYLVLALSFCISLQSFATSGAAYLDQELSGWASPHLVVDDKVYDMGQWAPYYGIENVFEEGSPAAQYAKLHVKHATRAAWGIWGGIGVYAATALATDRNDPSDDEVLLGGLAILLGAVLYGGYQAGLSRAYLYKAINSHNGIEPMSRRTDLSLNNTQLGWTLSF